MTVRLPSLLAFRTPRITAALVPTAPEVNILTSYVTIWGLSRVLLTAKRYGSVFKCGGGVFANAAAGAKESNVLLTPSFRLTPPFRLDYGSYYGVGIWTAQ